MEKKDYKSSKDYDLDKRINILYNLYNLNKMEEYTVEPIVLGQIGIDDIKIKAGDNTMKEEILSGRFKLVEYNEDEQIVVFKKYSNTLPVTVKVSFYNNGIAADINKLDNSVNSDSLFSYILSTLVLNRKTRHIILPIVNVDAKLKDIEKYIKEDPCYNKIKNYINNNIIVEDCCLQVREHFFRTITMEEYFKENSCKYKPLLFQVIHTLATIQNEYNGFKHNKLLLKNIILYLKGGADNYSEYDGINGTFHVPNPGFDIKIGNFEHSTIPKYYGKETDGNDLFTFLNDMLEGTTKMSSYSNKCDKETLDFLERVVPKKDRGINKMKPNTPISSPADLLHDKYFEEYKNKQSKNNTDTEPNITSHMYLTGKIETYMDSDNFSTLGNQDKIISNTNIMKKVSGTRILESRDKATTLSRTIKSGGDSNLGDKATTLSRTIRMEEANENIIVRKQKGGDDSEVQSQETRSERPRFDRPRFDNNRSDTRNERPRFDNNRSDNRERPPYDNNRSDKPRFEKPNPISVKDIQDGIINKPSLPPFKGEKYSPFITNERREINRQRFDENPIREPAVLLEQKIYDTSQKQAPKSQFPQPFVPLYDNGGGIVSSLLPYNNVVNQPPIQKIYNVTLANPLGNYTTLNRVNEDMLPGAPRAFSALTVHERLELINYLRNTIINKTDGEEMNITGGDNSLLSYLKVLDLNPYSSGNPITKLAKDFILYRAAYPIRLDEKTKMVALAKNTMGMNVRMYKLNKGALQADNLNEWIHKYDFDVWREIGYYYWVKSELLSKKIAPNFIAPILYKVDTKSNIDWSKLESIKLNGKSIINFDNMLKKEKKVNNKLYYSHGPELKVGLAPGATVNADGVVEKVADLTDDSKKTLILLTEAPTTNILKWASSDYEAFGTKRIMVATGYHSDEVWKSILFQMVYIFSVLQEKGIFIPNISLERNFFIKDIFSDANAIGSWIYKINNVDYYIPNYGYILQFDSSYGSPTDEEHTNYKHKIYSSMFGDKDDIKNSAIKTKVLDQFNDFMNASNFISAVSKNAKISDKTRDFINKIKSAVTPNIIDIFSSDLFIDFVHNRAGTLLLKSERENINTMTRPNFIKSKLMVCETRNQEYKWVVYFGPSKTSNFKKAIVTRDDNSNINKFIEVFNSSLYGYPESERVLPDSSKQFKYDDNHIYETYNL